MRTFLQDALSCSVVHLETEKQYPLERLTDEGLFEGFIAGEKECFPYRLRVEQSNGEIRQFYDPYSFLPTLGEQDIYFFSEGTDTYAYKKMGAHPRTHQGIAGVSFAVWAPNALRVSVVGNFNHWDGRYHAMRTLGSSGVWEIFIPGLPSGTIYKYEIVGPNEDVFLKTDPYGSSFESPPNNASIVVETEGYTWNDQTWLEQRAKTDWKKAPISVYELHLGSWKRKMEDACQVFTYREIAPELADYVKKMGFTHVEFMPLAEHPFAGSWGYQVTGFFAPTWRFGSPDDFKYLVDYLHQQGIGIIMDWVPAHFPKDAFALAQFDGTALYEHSDPRQGYHHDWGTLIFNYGRSEVRGFLINSAVAWMERYHIDGLRVDAVASMLYLDYSREEGEWIPNKYGGRENIEALEFLRATNQIVHQLFPGSIMIAEESTSWGGVTQPVENHGLGFDFKWNMGWMHDNISYFNQDPIHRKYHHNQLSFGMLYQYSENFIQVFSHDEVVHGKGSMINKMAGQSMSDKANQLRALYTYMWMWPGKKTLFMGSEFGQSAEWKYDEQLDWYLLQYQDHAGIQTLIADLNQLYTSHLSLAYRDHLSGGFSWINVDDWENSCLSFLRKGEYPSDQYVVVSNFTPVPRSHYQVGVPTAGYWKEIVNSNAGNYGGGGEGNFGGLSSHQHAANGYDQSLSIYLPGHTTLVFQYQS